MVGVVAEDHHVEVLAVATKEVRLVASIFVEDWRALYISSTIPAFALIPETA